MRHLIWLSLLFLFYTFPRRHATHQLCHHDQMYALLQFKNTLTIDDAASSECGVYADYTTYANYTNYAYPKTISWNNKSGNNSNCCLWDGVTCDEETGHVIELDLSCSQLNGTINSTIDNGIFHLTHLQRLNLAYNNFRESHISPSFGRFTKLTHLNLSFSSFTGSIPKELSFLSKLVSIDFSWNSYLSVKANDFDSLLKNLTHLKELVFTNVVISSNIPNSLMNLSSLEIIDLTQTDLHGILPGQIFMLPNLRELNLGFNNLTGDIPEINSTNTSSLQILDMGYNKLFGQRGLPGSIGNLKSLRYLYLSDTSLAGELSDSFWNLKSLRHLDLSDTSLAGELPDSIGSLESLTTLYLNNCSLSGSIPKSIGNLTELTELYLTVHGMEYGFGAHDLPISGVFEVEPKSCPGFIYRNSIQLGKLNMPHSEFRNFIENLASEYHGDTYHLLSKNCNHFTDDVAWRLVGTRIPGWINRLARLGTVCSCLLPESLQVTTVKQLPEYHSRTDEEGSDSVSATSNESMESLYYANQDHHLLSPSTASSDVTFIKETQR